MEWLRNGQATTGFKLYQTKCNALLQNPPKADEVKYFQSVGDFSVLWLILYIELMRRV